jgi:hypothetical protein
MDAFEAILAELLERDGYWVRKSVKVKLTKEEKIAIGRPSSPRWELDLVAYKGSNNELLVIECKSYLDSYGVRFSAFNSSSERHAKRFKLFNDNRLREVVFNRLVLQLESAGFYAPSPTIILCLAAGKVIRESDRYKIKEYFNSKGWLFWDDQWIRNRLKAITETSYEDSIATMVSKLLLRE